MEVQILVTLQVDCDAINLPLKTIRNSVSQAVFHAMRNAEDNGFNHRMADSVTIGFVDCEPFEEKEGV